MQINFTPQARSELIEAALFYEAIEPGLGTDFEEEVSSFLQSITAAPERPRLRQGGYRRVNLRRFPYYISYAAVQGGLTILAIGHGARKPEYWIGRKL